jgi:energy-coupling factor transport system substrate-specific component
MGNKKLTFLGFNTPSLVLIPAAVGFNYIGKYFAMVLKLPLWLDSIGTVLASILAGPIIGALCGAINNVISGLTVDPIAFIYAVTSIAIGLTTGILAKKDYFSSFRKAFGAGIIVAAVAAIVSTPINIWFWKGQTGNIWGDALYAFLVAQHHPVWLASFLDEIVVDLPDKIITVIFSFMIFKSLPQKLTYLFGAHNKIETL